MKKKLCMLTLLAAASMMVFTGCSSTDGGAGSSADEVMDDIADVAEDLSDTHFYSVMAAGPDDAILQITTVDEAGESQVEETGMQGWDGEAGTTIAELMADWDMTAINAVCTDCELAGWQAYETVVEVDADGFENYTEQVLYDGKIFTTEEMLNQELPESDVHFDTVWSVTCSGCEETKVCNVYYVDDAQYFVCEDCNESFLYGMGLAE